MGDCTKEEGNSKTVSDAPPCHYIVKIQSVSLLTKNHIDKYTSDDFEAGGYEWKLVFYPNGNKSKSVTDHISVYLKMAETSSLHPGWEVHAVIRLFLFDQKKDNYYVVQDAEEKTRRFRAMKVEWGYDRFIPLTTFNSPSNGYVVDDVCVFGAEVFVRKEIRSPGKDCLSMIKDPVSDKYTWKINEFSSLKNECCDSNAFQHWKMRIYPKGNDIGAGTHVSLYLALANPSTLTQIYAEFTLRIIDQINNKHLSSDKASYWFNATNTVQGWPRFISIRDFSKSGAGFLVKDTCIIEAEVRVLGVANALE